MTEFVHVTPAKGGRVRMPDRNSAVMPEEGAIVPRIDYYERLILAGDVIVSKDQPAAVKADASAPATPAPAKQR